MTLFEATLDYLVKQQDFKSGEYYGAFWSEKAYHGPLLDWHAGGSHHYKGTASAALSLWLEGVKKNNSNMMHNSEEGFDWLVAKQHQRGGWMEIQNNEKPSDWENTGLEELSTIETAFAIHGLGMALLNGLAPKKSYMDSMQKAGHWFLSIEWPAGSGVFPHHERSPYDTLNAGSHAIESLFLIYKTMKKTYGKTINIFHAGALRGLNNLLKNQWTDGCYPYRNYGNSTINYTSLVIWCILNSFDILEDQEIDHTLKKKTFDSFSRAAEFLRSCIDDDGSLLWEKNETTTAKYNIWTYAITINVLRRLGGKRNIEKANKLFGYISKMRTKSGLLPMRARGEEIIACTFMQADILLFLSKF